MHIKKEYKTRKKKIQRRLKEFAKIGHKKNPDELFLELCYCLCTPLSKAEKVYKIINKENKEKLKLYNPSDLSSFLKGNCRFHNNKAKYICQSRNHMPLIMHLPKDPINSRDLLAKNIKGLGYKEASHFLRNIGYRKVAILDSHILTTLHSLRVLKSNKRPKSKREYLEMENKMKQFADKIKIDMDELDLLFWSMRTGIVLK